MIHAHDEWSRPAVGERAATWRAFAAGLIGLVLVMAPGCATGGPGGGSGDNTPVNDNTSDGANGNAADGTPPGPNVTACNSVTALFSAEAILDDPAGPCFEWVDRTHGRAVLGSTSSAAIWSRRTEFGTGIVTGAAHTLGLGWFGPQDTDIEEAMGNPADQIGVARLFLSREDGSGTDELASPLFNMYNPEISAERNNNFLRDLLPREDFYVAAVDSQKLDMELPVPRPEPLLNEELPLYDPANATTSDPTYVDPAAGELVLMLGYPREGDFAGALAASVGRVLSDDEAEQAIADLANLGDEEGEIAYEAEVETIIEGQAVTGMSGGAAFNRNGQQVGILVRATEIHDGVQYVRAVRMTYAVSRLAIAFNALTPAEQDAVRPYLELME